MTSSTNAFSINDALSTSDNLTSFEEVLRALDESLGSALAPHLSGLAAGQALDKPAIWASLYAATEPSADHASEEAAEVRGSGQVA